MVHGRRKTEFHNDVLIYHERGTEPRGRYEFRIEGFDEPFVFEVVDPKTIKDVKKLGYSMTKNDTTVSARAFLREEGIEVEYYVLRRKCGRRRRLSVGFIPRFTLIN